MKLPDLPNNTFESSLRSKSMKRKALMQDKAFRWTNN